MPKVWQAFAVDLPCNFQHCDEDCAYTEFHFTPWCKPIIIHVIEALKEEETAVLAPFQGLKNDELRRFCRDNNLRVSGNKAELIARLITANVQQ